jgi:hypothetical protein
MNNALVVLGGLARFLLALGQRLEILKKTASG